MRTAIDCDGVLAELGEHVLTKFGMNINQDPIDDIWAMVVETPDFWPTMPLKFGASRLWLAAQALNPVVITGCPAAYFDAVAIPKTRMLRERFGTNIEVITCVTRDKVKYITSPEDILIDDFPSQVRRWRKAGGRAIHCRDSYQAVRELNTMVLAVGDKVQALVNDVYALPGPKPIVDIQQHDGAHWVFVEGSMCGVPIHDVVLIQKAA